MIGLLEEMLGFDRVFATAPHERINTAWSKRQLIDERRALKKRLQEINNELLEKWHVIDGQWRDDNKS